MKFTTKKKEIRYGNVEIPPDAFKPENVKIKVTAYIDLDILQALKQEAKKSGTKYQTLMNQKLRDSTFGKKIDPILIHEIRDIVRKEIKKLSA